MKQNIQILLETMLRCGGNCSGCALSSVERMTKFDMDWDLLIKKSKAIKLFLEEKKDFDNIESISIFLGQGDHFLMDKEEIEPFVKICSEMIPVDLKHKTVVLITASAIGKEKMIKEKMDLFYDTSIKYNLPFFIQVVFDPKKIKVKKEFTDIYINNILYFKNKCGMTELTINLGKDILDMSPLDFHNWVISYGFIHVEINWVMNKQTQEMWIKNSDLMFKWLIDLLEINAKDHKYEINFVPFLARMFNFKSINNTFLIKNIQNELLENIYIDNVGNINLAQIGLITNLIPLNQRLEKQQLTIENIQSINSFAIKNSKEILGKVLRKKSCVDCEYNKICSQIGSSIWFDFENKKTNNCPWNIKDFLIYFENYLKNYSQFKKTKFNKNPIQNNILNKDNNKNYEYFENKFLKKVENE